MAVTEERSSTAVLHVRRPTSGDRTDVHRRTGVSEMVLTFSVILSDQAVDSSRSARASWTERVKRYGMAGAPRVDDRRGAGVVPWNAPPVTPPPHPPSAAMAPSGGMTTDHRETTPPPTGPTAR